jgi:two-component system NtrC family response regulator
MGKVLIIDDDVALCDMLIRLVERMGHQTAAAYELAEGMQKVRAQDYDVVFLDVRLPDGNGLEVLPDIRRTSSRPEVIIMTGVGDPDGAELAIKNGAWDYIEKPASIDKMRLPLMRALEFRSERAATQAPKVLQREDIVGDSPAMRGALALMAQAAASDANVLITGDTGTGKELFARGVHVNSARSEGSFVVVDCAALPETLVESLLFGHVKGSFTGADKRQRGLIEQAHGGTLFLDEVGELPMALQRSFLRVIQERQFRPIGADHELESDFRLIAATNRELEEMVEAERFREDLFFRLRSFHLELPPLREHLEDLPDVVAHHVNRLCSRYKVRPKSCAPDLLDALASYHWPGNVRELVNVLERTIASAGEEPILFAYHLPTYLRVQLARAAVSREPEAGQPEEPGTPGGPPATLGTLKEVRDQAVAQAEKRYLEDLMAYTGGEVKRACQVSDLSRGRLYALMKKHGVQRPRE